MSLKEHRFIEANSRSPVVYVGVDKHSCTYRLADGSTWTFSIRESREIGVPRFAHLEAA
jgi:hypothetical protein